MAKLQAQLYMDTICSHSWNARIPINRLREEYGGLLDFDYTVYPLFTAGQIQLSRSTRWWLVPHWGEVSEFGGEPIAHSMWVENPITDSSTAGEAYLAARRQGLDLAHRYLERLQLGVMAQRQRISDTEVLHRLAEQVGLDGDRLLADLEQVQAAHEMAAVMAAAKSRGIRSRPTLALTNEAGREYRVVGPQPYAEFVKAVEVLQAGAAAPPLTIVGGRILGFSDLSRTDTVAAPAGLDFTVGVSDGRPAVPKRPDEAAVRLLRVKGGTLAPEVLGGLWRAGLNLLTVWGRAAALGPEPVYLTGVRAVGFEARARAESQFALLKTALERAGVQAAPATEAEREWLTGMNRRAASPSVLQFLPAGPRRPEALAAALPDDFALLTLADPIHGPAVAAKGDALAAARDRYAARLSDPEYHAQALALVESLAHRKAHYRRWSESAPVGMWRTFACLLAAGDAQAAKAGTAALRELYFDPNALSPVSVQPFQVDAAEHIREHIETFTLCEERWIHGADWWNTPLTGRELARYVPGLFGIR